jgi:hypothetical protein
MIYGADELDLALRRIARRCGIAAAVRTLARAAALATGALLLWALATLVVPVAFPLRLAVTVAAAALVVAFPVLARWYRPPALAAARLADARLGLADRLGTAADLLGRPEAPTGLARLQVACAIESARAVVPHEVAPMRVPRETWAAAGGCALLVLWAQFLAGWSLPATPAARTLAVIHHQGRTLEALGHRLDTAARAQALPETRRVAPQITALGRRLEGARVGPRNATAMLREAARQLDAAQQMVEHRLFAALPHGAGTADRTTVPFESPAQRLAAFEEEVRQLRALTSRLGSGGVPPDRADISNRLAALSEALNRTGAPNEARRSVAAARRDAQRGQTSAAARDLADAMADLQSLERMMGDEQALGRARAQVRRSAEQIARSASLGSLGTPAPQAAEQGPPRAAPNPAPGPNPPAAGSDESAPPPPGPNQGSLPGVGTGTRVGAPAPRLGGTHVPVFVTGAPGPGASSLREITAPGRKGAPRLAATRPPAQVAHEIDRALSQGQALPPEYLDVIRRYFQHLGASP